MATSDRILRLFDERAAYKRNGRISLRDAALEAAHLAERSGAPPSLVLAALLRDVGHLIGDEASLRSTGAEEIGAAWLSRYLGPEVTEPIRLHVIAKRYLCTRTSHYLTRLTKEARRSYERQGGSLDPREMAEFVKNPYYLQALTLRRWVDVAKIPEVRVPDFEHYRPMLDRAILTRGEAPVVA